jgi:hypothetical protein
MRAPRYQFHYGQPSNFVEIYLPKKAAFQGALYDTLKDGFDLKKVKKHLRDNRAAVQEFLKHHEELSKYTEKQIDRLSPSFNGYSLYELDGVFRYPPMPAEPYKLAEERVQVVRLMFLPPKKLLSSVSADSKEERELAARRYVRFWTQNLREYNADVKRSQRKVRGRKAMARVLKDWLEDVGLFLHGYILFKICQAIEEKAGKVGAPDDPEAEIWLTASRCTAVVRTTRK